MHIGRGALLVYNIENLVKPSCRVLFQEWVDLIAALPMRGRIKCPIAAKFYTQYGICQANLVNNEPVRLRYPIGQKGYILTYSQQERTPIDYKSKVLSYWALRLLQ